MFDLDQLEHLSTEDFFNFKKAVEDAEQKRRKVDKAKAVKDIWDRMKLYGLTLEDIAKSNNKKVNKNPIKYQDPGDPKKTWVGTGNTPKWLQKHLDAGKKLEDFLVAQEEETEKPKSKK